MSEGVCEQVEVAHGGGGPLAGEGAMDGWTGCNKFARLKVRARELEKDGNLEPEATYLPR